MAMKKRIAPRANPCLLVMDAGGTHTRALVVTLEGVRLGGAEAGPANSFLVPGSSEARNIRAAARAALASARVSASSVAAAVIGSASVDFDGLWGEPIESALRRELPKTRLRAVADAEIARQLAMHVSFARPAYSSRDGRGDCERNGIRDSWPNGAWQVRKSRWVGPFNGRRRKRPVDRTTCAAGCRAGGRRNGGLNFADACGDEIFSYTFLQKNHRARLSEGPDAQPTGWASANGGACCKAR